MSRHQAYRNYDYEEDLDEFDGEELGEEEEELSPEDKGQLAVNFSTATADLKLTHKGLKAQMAAGTEHYYYDIDKSVAYLVNKFVAQKPGKSKPKKGGGMLNVSFGRAAQPRGAPVYCEGDYGKGSARDVYAGATLAAHALAMGHLR